MSARTSTRLEGMVCGDAGYAEATKILRSATAPASRHQHHAQRLNILSAAGPHPASCQVTRWIDKTGAAFRLDSTDRVVNQHLNIGGFGRIAPERTTPIGQEQLPTDISNGNGDLGRSVNRLSSITQATKPPLKGSKLWEAVIQLWDTLKWTSVEHSATQSRDIREMACRLVITSSQRNNWQNLLLTQYHGHCYAAGVRPSGR